MATQEPDDPNTRHPDSSTPASTTMPSAGSCGTASRSTTRASPAPSTIAAIAWNADRVEPRTVTAEPITAPSGA
ncbi:hypothetical protein [Cellulomonas denverensis]|uniref:hypothetical protein n=1 Tax=Cellulomonas denverensis TaxID=264297 RepID=UPI0035EEC6F7